MYVAPDSQGLYQNIAPNHQIAQQTSSSRQ